MASDAPNKMVGKWDMWHSKAKKSSIIAPGKTFKAKIAHAYTIGVTKKGNISVRKNGKSIFCTRDKPIKNGIGTVTFSSHMGTDYKLYVNGKEYKFQEKKR